MKIGILTYHSVYNFGANLQVYSTVGYLRHNGFDPVVINWIPADLEARYNRTTPLKQAEAHNKFIKNFIPCSNICRTIADITNVITKETIKGVIIGSDAVLQHTPFLTRIFITKKGVILKKPGSDVLFPNPFWGSFIPYLENKIPVVIMSASSQNTNYKYIRGNVKKKINNHLNQFQSITVRDDWTRRMVKYLTNGEIIPSITPDPVFAFNQNITQQFSKEEILTKFKLPQKYLLLSIRSQECVSKNWLDSFKRIAEQNKLHCVLLTMPDGINFDHPFSSVIHLPLSPDEWYGIIRYSSGYVGENLHPIIVALHNEVPFYSFDSYGIVRYKFFVNEKSSKIYDILSQADFLKNRINILGKGYKCPTPEEVLSQINDFDFLKCHLFSIKQLNNYNLMMKGITSLF